MAETDETAGGGAAGAVDAAGESGDTGEEAGELRAEEESARAMEAEVPHPAGYEDPGQEQPS
jgi:hypothetical protein